MKIKNIKTIKTMTIMVFMIGLFLADVVWAAPQWAPVTGNEHNMVAYGKIATGMDFSSGGRILYSFGPAGEQDCRSRSMIGADGSYFATIVGDAAGEAIHFKIVDESGNVYDLMEKITFTHDATKEKLDLY